MFEKLLRENKIDPGMLLRKMKVLEHEDNHKKNFVTDALLDEQILNDSHDESSAEIRPTAGSTH